MVTRPGIGPVFTVRAQFRDAAPSPLHDEGDALHLRYAVRRETSVEVI
jgi:hypothetical protein